MNAIVPVIEIFHEFIDSGSFDSFQILVVNDVVIVTYLTDHHARAYRSNYQIAKILVLHQCVLRSFVVFNAKHRTSNVASPIRTRD